MIDLEDEVHRHPRTFSLFTSSPARTCAATMRARLASLASLVAACSCRMISPRVVGSSHSLQGYEAERVADGNEKTYWLVPGGQRMEAMS